MLTLWAWPGCIVIKFTSSASVAQGLQVRILGVDIALLIKPHCGGLPHKIAEDGHGC